MTHKLAADKIARTYIYESLEERLALTVHALSDLPDLLQFSGVDSTSLDSHSISGVADPSQQVDYVRNHYSFDGSGQTVAIIDSGIAWDHYALGGGFGEDFRVVGGWDFAENDGDPFDDGPAGFHGTHVAGIVGSDDSVHEGVASGVDLVGLRVFDDMGNGKLEWVEQALQWVHEHRNDFQNPITTVNLSLGVNWNSDSIPGWANLEDEFAQLKKDGIFISVAAGNSFQDYLTKGVSYPAASQSVVPVASHGSTGMLSDFSQRNDRALVAPGENISSTIPAHLFGINGPSSKFMATSGTSMAAPWLAGASVLLREAFEVAGAQNIDQQSLYQHFNETADEIYDSVTHSWYSRLNLSAAIDAALEDGHGDQIQNATHLGDLSNADGFKGILAKSNDVDYLKFTADESGRVTLSLTNSDGLDALLSIVGQAVSRNGSEVSFDVEAGQEYFVRLHSNSGQGNYQVALDFDSSTPLMQDLGIVRSNRFENLTVNGEAWFQITASRDAVLTVEALSNSLLGGIQSSLSFEIYDGQQNLVGTGTNQAGLRSDLVAKQGGSFLIKVIGNSDNFDLKFTNLIRTVGNRVIVGGTGQADNYAYQSLDGEHRVEVNGTTYRFSKTDFAKIRINGGTGQDHIQLTGSDQYENLSGASGQLVFFGLDTDVISKNFESMVVDGNGGNDLAVLGDTVDDDFFRGTSTQSTLTGGGYSLSVEGFDRVTVISRRGGIDRAELIGSVGDDFLHIHRHGTSLAGEGFQNYVIGFQDVFATGGTGSDYVIARGTEFNETLTVDATESVFENVQGQISFRGFGDLTVTSGGGVDVASFTGIRNSDSLNRTRDAIEGEVFGAGVMIEDYQQVTWTPELEVDSEIGLSAVEEIFDQYSNE